MADLDLIAPLCAITLPQFDLSQCDSAAADAANGARLISVARKPLCAQSFLRPLESVSQPSHIPAGVLLAALSTRDLRLETPSPVGFDFHWIRELAAGVLRGASGLRLQASGDATLRAAFSGDFVATVTRDDVAGEPWLRLLLSTSNQQSLSAQARARISAQTQLSAPDSPDELLCALLNLHPLQWFRDTLGDIGSLRLKRLAKDLGVAVHEVEVLLDSWRTQGARAESTLWRAAMSQPQLQQLLDWSDWLTRNGNSVEAIQDHIQHALNADSTFVTSPAGQWLEAVTGVALSAPLPASSLENLRAGASLLRALQSKPFILRLLNQLCSRTPRMPDLQSLLPWAERRLRALLGETPSPADLPKHVAAWTALRDRVYNAAREALDQKLPLELSVLLERSSGGSALADVSFRFDPSGLALFQRVLQGDLTPLFSEHSYASCLRLRNGLLTHHIRRARQVEIHLPFLGRKQLQRSLEAMARAEVSHDGSGRVLVYGVEATDQSSRNNERQTTLMFSAALTVSGGEPRNDNCRFAFTDIRNSGPGQHQESWLRMLEAYGLPAPALPAAPWRATLNITLPGELAEVWANAPHSKDVSFMPVMCRVSRIIQASMRRWLPTIYLSDLDRFRSPTVVHPLLAYQCSAPYTGAKKGEFAYDFMDDASRLKALNSSAVRLPAALAAIQQTLRQAGKPRWADFYDPRDVRALLESVNRKQINFMSLLAADAFFIEELVGLTDCGRKLRAAAQHSPKDTVKLLTKSSADLVATFQRRLRRLYGGDDFVALGSLFLVEATAALSGDSGPKAPIAATLTIESAEGRQLYLNDEAKLHAGAI
jgi:hypothetical protein